MLQRRLVVRLSSASKVLEQVKALFLLLVQPLRDMQEHNEMHVR